MQNPDEDTEWNDILREKGILPPKPNKDLEVTEEQIGYLIDAVVERRLEGEDKTLDELDEMLEEDGMMDDEESFIREYREKRMREFKAAAAKEIFGELIPISKPDFVRQVTEASKNHPVVVFLYRNGIPASQVLHGHLKTVAARQKATKFTAIESTQCIPNYPDKNVPTLLLYRNGDMVHQLVGLECLGGMKTSVKVIESILSRHKMISKNFIQDKDEGEGEDEDDDDDDYASYSKVKNK